MSDDNAEYFTMVFMGNIAVFKGNPFKTDTPFGRPVGVSRGDVLAEADDLRAQIEDLNETDTNA